MKKKAIAAALSSLLVLSMGTAAFAADSQSSTEITATIEGGYTVTIPTSIDLGTVGAEDFAPKPMQTTEYGVFEEDYQYMVDTDFDIKVDGWYADNQYVKVTTDKIATLTDSGSEATVPVTVYPYERAFDEAATKTSTVTLYKDDAQPGDFTGTATFDIELVTYDPQTGIKMGLYNNAFKTDDYAVAAFGSTDSEHIAALAEMGYEAAYGFNADLYAEMNEKGIEIAGANTMSAIPGNEAYDSYSTAEKIVASAKYYKEQGYSFENFDYSYYPFGMFTEGIDSYEAYAEKWEAGIESAVQMNKELEQAAQDLGYGEIDFWLTQENEPMGQPGQSALEVAMFINCVQHASDEAGVKNYMKVSVDLVHAYSFLNLELEPRAVTQQYCVDYMETQDWAKMLFYNSPYFEQELKIQIPETIEQYMSLLDGQVSVIQFSDNNGSTKSPFGEGKGSATGSHHVIGEGRIDYLEYMDALCNIAHMTDLGSYWVYEPWYNQNNETTQQNLVQGIRDGVMWMTEWNLLYAVDTL